MKKFRNSYRDRDGYGDKDEDVHLEKFLSNSTISVDQTKGVEAKEQELLAHFGLSAGNLAAQIRIDV